MPTQIEVWLTFRRELYHDLSEEFDEKEMEAIANDSNRASFLALIEDQYVGLLELSLRNIVDGCLSSPGCLC